MHLVMHILTRHLDYLCLMQGDILSKTNIFIIQRTKNVLFTLNCAHMNYIGSDYLTFYKFVDYGEVS